MGRPCICCRKKEEKKRRAIACYAAVMIDEASPYRNREAVYDADLQALRNLEFGGDEPLGEIPTYFFHIEEGAYGNIVLPPGRSFPEEVKEVYSDVVRYSSNTLGFPDTIFRSATDEWKRRVTLPCKDKDYVSPNDRYCVFVSLAYDATGSSGQFVSAPLRVAIGYELRDLFEFYQPSFYVQCEDKIVDFDEPIELIVSNRQIPGENWVQAMTASLQSCSTACPQDEEPPSTPNL